MNQNVKTAVRIRPQLKEEAYLSSHYNPYVEKVNLHEKPVLRVGHSLDNSTFDYIFCKYTTQETLFHAAVAPQLDEFVNGQDISVVVYGNQGAGKSHTMFGPGLEYNKSAEDYGILPRAAIYLFSNLQEYLKSCTIVVSIIEIDTIYSAVSDLLADSQIIIQPLKIYMNEKGYTNAAGVREKECTSAAELMQCLHQAMLKRNKIVNWCNDTLSVMVVIKLIEFPDVPGRDLQLKSQAVFMELAAVPGETDTMNSYSHMQNFFPNTLLMLYSLVEFRGQLRKKYHFSSTQTLYWFLQDIFSGRFNTLLLCCVSPSNVEFATTNAYLGICSTLFYGSKPLDESELFKSQDSIMNLPELFSRLSCSEDNTHNHTPSKGGEEELANTYGLERIEEVTESEEELASSNEKMSESHLSSDDSVCDSDQEEENKVCRISQIDFNNNLNNYCSQFTCYVDSFVDSFKSTTEWPVVKGCKQSSSTARRGATQYSRDVGSQSDFLNLQPQRLNQRGSAAGSASASATTVDSSDGQGPSHTFMSLGSVDIPNFSGNVASKSDEPTFLKLMIKHEETVRQLKQIWTTRMASRNVVDSSKQKQLLLEANDEDVAIKKLVYDLQEITEHMENLLKPKKFSDVDVFHYKRIQFLKQSRMNTSENKNNLNKLAKDKLIDSEGMRDKIICEEIMELLDVCVECLSKIVFTNTQPQQTSLSDTKIGQNAAEILSSLNHIEIAHIFHHLFKRVVDLRESGIQSETTISQQDQLIEVLERRIVLLKHKIQKMREESVPQLAMPALAGEGTTNTLAMPEASTSSRPTTIPPRLKELSAKSTPPFEIVLKRHNNRFSLNQFCKKQ